MWAKIVLSGKMSLNLRDYCLHPLICQWQPPYHTLPHLTRTYHSSCLHLYHSIFILRAQNLPLAQLNCIEGEYHAPSSDLERQLASKGRRSERIFFRRKLFRKRIIYPVNQPPKAPFFLRHQHRPVFCLQTFFKPFTSPPTGHA